MCRVHKAVVNYQRKNHLPTAHATSICDETQLLYMARKILISNILSIRNKELLHIDVMVKSIIRFESVARLSPFLPSRSTL